MNQRGQREGSPAMQSIYKLSPGFKGDSFLCNTFVQQSTNDFRLIIRLQIVVWFKFGP